MGTSIEFADAFQELSGAASFPWQQALCKRLISDRPDNLPSSANLPTRLRKAAVVAGWLIAMAARPSRMPCRLVSPQAVRRQRRMGEQSGAPVHR